MGYMKRLLDEKLDKIRNESDNDFLTEPTVELTPTNQKKRKRKKSRKKKRGKNSPSR